MKCMIPEEITEVDLLSCSVAIDETVYDPGTTYNTGDRCRVGLFVYEAAKDGLTGADPGTNAGGNPVNKDWLAAGYTAVDDPSWLVVGMVNRWKQFDSYVSTQTVAEGIVEQIIKKLYVDTLYFLNIYGSYLIIQILSGDDIVLWETEINLRANDVVYDEWEMYWKPIPEPIPVVKVELGMTTGATDKIRMAVYGAYHKVPEASGEVRIGKVVAGMMIELGKTQWKFEDGFIDYSVNTTDQFGESYRKEGRYAPVIKAYTDMPLSEKDAVKNFLIGVRAKDCVWDYNESPLLTLTSHIVFGLCQECKFVTTKRADTLAESRTLCSTKIEGAV